jgi:hypothetical protein
VLKSNVITNTSVPITNIFSEIFAKKLLK